MHKFTTCLWFQNNEARTAAEFYTSTFPDSYLEQSLVASGDYPGGAEGQELIVAFTVLGQAFVGLNAGAGSTPNKSVSFQVMTETQEETDTYWNAIIDNGGAEGQCGWCEDRWGFSWQITPFALMAGMANPDRAVAGRVMQAMMTMRRIIIADIEAALEPLDPIRV